MKSLILRGIGSAVLVALSTFGTPDAGAAPQPGLDAPALPSRTWTARLAVPRPEAPPAFDPEADVDRCAVCRLAAETTGKLPTDSYRVEGRVTDTGAAVRLVSDDPEVRDALWHATLARGEVLAALRSGADVRLCASCRARRDALNALEISARRIPEGVLLVYSSTSAVVVQQLHTVVRAGRDAPLQF